MIATRALLALSLSMLLASAHAFGAGEDGRMYAGFSAGMDMVNVAGMADDTTLGVLVGYSFAESVSGELALNRSSYEFRAGGPGCSIDNTTVGAYAALRTQGQFYLKGRAGLLMEDLSPVGPCPASSVSDTGLSLGGGGGLQFGNALLELEVTMVEADINRAAINWLYRF